MFSQWFLPSGTPQSTIEATATSRTQSSKTPGAVGHPHKTSLAPATQMSLVCGARLGKYKGLPKVCSEAEDAKYCQPCARQVQTCVAAENVLQTEKQTNRDGSQTPCDPTRVWPTDARPNSPPPVPSWIVVISAASGKTLLQHGQCVSPGGPERSKCQPRR